MTCIYHYIVNGLLCRAEDAERLFSESQKCLNDARKKLADLEQEIARLKGELERLKTCCTIDAMSYNCNVDSYIRGADKQIANLREEEEHTEIIVTEESSDVH